MGCQIAGWNIRQMELSRTKAPPGVAQLWCSAELRLLLKDADNVPVKITVNGLSCSFIGTVSLPRFALKISCDSRVYIFNRVIVYTILHN